MEVSREAFWQRLEGPLDLLVIGGGATGAGVLWEATLRGLRAALVEARDFASGTSSRSTKLLHGGVRYLELALRRLDRRQLRLVVEALRERMGCAATLEESRVLGRLPAERNYRRLEGIPQEVWYALLDRALRQGSGGATP
ncbi:MAG: FAD-dependent oxidoreductase [Thermus sp.]|nr:FAD-dependent oxidoreductase [Thermus sp.]MDW8358833.1 FAD-dependent oxidoreductase [Thermus sp.]